jgi:hypothetical protein
MTDTLSTILGWITAGALGTFALGIFTLHQWLKSREQGEVEDDED